MSREKNIFEKFPKKWPKGPFGKPVRGERGNHDLPSGAKGGENMDLERHYEHKQHAFDSFCKRCCGARPSMPTVPLGAGRTDLCH